jgi:hypothetical protein
MTFENKISTRNLLSWLVAGIATSLGVPIALMFGIGMIYDGFDFGALFALIIGISFLCAGMASIHGIIFSKVLTRIVSSEMIICKSNGNIICQIKKEDIKEIFIYEGDVDSVDIEMKNNERISFPGNYLMGISRFRSELKMCEYPVN